MFDAIVGTNSIGVFKFTNPNPANGIISVSIEKSVFSNNRAASMTLISIKNSSASLWFNQSQFINNQISTVAGGLFYLSNLYSSNISVTNCNFTQSDTDMLSIKPQLNVFEFLQSQGNVQLNIQNSTLEVKGQMNGNFISIEGGQYNDAVSVSGLNYSALSAADDGNETNEGSTQSLLIPQFSLFEGENIKANFQNLRVSQSQINQKELITINCNPAIKTVYACEIEVLESSFQHLILNQPIITINSQGTFSSNALDNLTVLIENSTFATITWINSSSSAIGINERQGIVRSTTPLIGRTPGQRNFAITIKDCDISQLQGTHGLLYNGVETMFDLVLLLQDNVLASIDAIGPGGIIHASMSELTTFESKVSTDTSRNASFRLSLNNFTNISIKSTGGSILYWTSQLRGISIISENNTFSDINCSQGSGGAFFVKYTPINPLSLTVPLSPEYLVILASTFDFYNQIIAHKGAIVYAEGMNTLMNLNFTENSLHFITSKSNGGIIMIDAGIYSVSTSFSYSSPSRILNTALSGPDQLGTVDLIRNDFKNISAQNGGILFESTPTGTMNITAVSNNFREVEASSRGGIFFLNQQNVSIFENILNEVFASATGSFIYSVAGQINTTRINASNEFFGLSPKQSLYSFGPTNLAIQFLSLSEHPNSVYHYEESSPTSSPVISNLTSYSLTEYLINFTLVYQDNVTNHFEVVLDESQSKMLNLTFITPDGLLIQNYLTTNCSNSTCTASPTAIILKGNAGDLIFVNATYQSEIYTQSQSFYIKLRECVPGEINNTENGQCLYCKSGSYSLVTNDTKCQSCPIGAICNGGSSISLRSTYYRSLASNSILIIVPCNDSGNRCLGGDNQTMCSNTYLGPVCTQCNFHNGYLSSGKPGVCTECYDEQKLIAYAVLLLTASIVYQIIMIVVTYKENKNIHDQYLLEKNQKDALESSRGTEIIRTIAARASTIDLLQMQEQSSVNGEQQQQPQQMKTKKEQQKKDLKPGALIVIFTAFSQISSILSNFDVGTVGTLISVSDSVSNSNVQAVFSLQCLYRLVNPDLFEGLKFETFVFVFSPIVKLALAAIVQLLLYLFSRVRKNFSPPREEGRKQQEEAKDNREADNSATPSFEISMPTKLPAATKRKKHESLTKLGAVAVVLFLLEQPGIITKLCQYLTCTKLDPNASQYYIQSRNNIECYTDQYNSFLYAVVIPALIFWAFLVPLTIFLVLYKKRNRLFESEPLRIILGNFYNAYSKDAYYWGLVVMVFKMLLFILDSALASSDFLKGIIFMLIIHVYFRLLKRKPPYEHAPLNKSEKYCSIAYMMVLTMVFARMSTESFWLIKLCDVMIMASTIGAGGYILMNVFWLYIMTAWELVKKLKDIKKNWEKSQMERMLTKKIIEDTMDQLRTYHEREQNYMKKKHPERVQHQRECKFKRRNAISVDTQISSKTPYQSTSMHSKPAKHKI